MSHAFVLTDGATLAMEVLPCKILAPSVSIADMIENQEVSTMDNTCILRCRDLTLSFTIGNNRVPEEPPVFLDVDPDAMDATESGKVPIL